ncbi:REP-associated tyrosine transposase [Marinomonas sp.]
MSWNRLKIGRSSTCNGEYFITFTTDKRERYFLEYDLAVTFCRQIAINENAFNCNWLTWVLMPDHFHGLLRLNTKEHDLAKVVGALKGSSSRIINKQLNRTGRLWQPNFFDRALRVEEDRKAVARYIVLNPIRKELVVSLKQYPFWDSIYL